MYLGFPEEGLARGFSSSMTLMFVSKNKQKGRSVALAALVLPGLFKKGLWLYSRLPGGISET